MHKVGGSYSGWMLEAVTIQAVQATVAQLISQRGFLNTPLSPELSLQDKFVILLDAYDELGQLLSADIVTIKAITRQVFQVAALAAMMAESIDVEELSAS